MVLKAKAKDVLGLTNIRHPDRVINTLEVDDYCGFCHHQHLTCDVFNHFINGMAVGMSASISDCPEFIPAVETDPQQSNR